MRDSRKETAEMTTVRLFVIALGVAAAWAATAGTASASGHPCNGPFCNQAAYPKYYTLGSHLFGSRQQLPVFQAAPWYLYWPLEAHFGPPAPTGYPFWPNMTLPPNSHDHGHGYPAPLGPVPAAMPAVH